MLIRSLLAVAVMALTLPLVDAAAAPSQPAAMVVVYPLIATQGAPPTVGAAVARVLIAGLSQKGQVVAKAAPPDTQQADYLQSARSLGADYYVAGFVSTIGSEVSAVEQLVATKSGIVVWRNTAAYTVPEDARASGIAMHDAIVALDTPQYVPPAAPAGAPAPAAPAASTAPAAKTSVARSAAPVQQAPLPIPQSSYADPATATAAAPDLDGPRVVVVNFGGPALDAVRHYVPSSIIRTLPRYHMSGTALDISTSDIAANGLVACAQTGSDYVLGGTLAAGEDGDLGLGYSIGAELDMNVYNCKDMTAKPRVIAKTTSNGNMQTAVDIAVDQALKVLASWPRSTAQH